VSIIIPIYNALPYAQACVERLLRDDSAVPFEIILIDDGSQPPVRDWLLGLQQRRDSGRLFFLSFDANRGFAAAVNAGAEVARGSLLCLLNSDTLITRGWLERMMAAMDARPDLGLVGPTTNMAGNLVQVDPEAPQHPEPAALEAFAAKRHADRRVVEVPGRLVFFCVLIRKHLWTAIGGVSTEYGSGNYEDDDFCLSARMAGYRLAVVPGAFVYHYNGRSFHSNRLPHADLLQRNGLLFARRARALAITGAPVPNPRSCARRVSVVVPFIDPEADLDSSLRSLARQTLTGFEVVVGNGSGRPLPLPHERLASERFSLREVITGPSLAEALNGAVAYTRGEVIAYLPAGAVHYPFHLEVILQHLASAAVVCTGFAHQRRPHENILFTTDFNLDINPTWVRPVFPLVAWAHQRRCLETVPSFDATRDTPVWDWQVRLLSIYAAERYPYLTCDAGLDPLERPSVDRLQEIYARFPAWDPVMGGLRHDAVLALQRDGVLASMPTRRGLTRHLVELARTLYRRAVPYEGRLRIDRGVRWLLRMPPVATDPDSLVARVRRIEPQGSLAVLSNNNGRDILQFGANPWDDLYQRQQHFGALLGRRGHRIFYIGPDFHVSETPWWDGTPLMELAPGVLEVRRLPALRTGLYGDDCLGRIEVEAMRLALEQIGRSYDLRDPVCLVHVPQWMPLIAELRQRHDWPVVYDCLDDQVAFSKTYGISGIREEEKLVVACDELIVTSAALQERWQARRAHIRLLPNACDYPLFSAPPACRLPLAVRQPVIGYYGTLSERMDLTLLRAVAEARPEWQFVFVGRASFARQPQDWWELTRLANIHVLPPVEQRTLAGYVSQFQVCLLPFHDNQMTRAMNFVKLYEYLAAGKPIVSAQLREVLPFAEQGWVRLYTGVDSFIEQVETCLREPPPADAARRFISQQTWEARVDVLEPIITGLSSSRITA
jgi:GT2 family glycosyltransferase/glycosyltransferase involved in cell wall biosynthesis